MKKALLVMFVLLVCIVTISACQGDIGPEGQVGPTGLAGPQGPAGAQGPAGKAVEEPKASVSSIVKGGLLYDKWWSVDAGAAQPSEDNPLWALQSTNTRTGGDTWRCKECHGWDYKGKGGAYSSGSHSTGFPGVYDASLTKNKAHLLDTLTGGTDYRHDLSSVLSDAALDNLVDFINEGLINDTKYIDYATKEVVDADLDNGKKLYDDNCLACHGADGKTIDIDDAGVGAIANGNPLEILHKIRFGHPGSAMPSSVQNGWSTQDAIDVLGYSQTLPE